LRAVDCAGRVVGVEALCATQALDFRDPPSAAPLAAVRERIRQEVSRLNVDRYLAPDIETVGRMVRDGELIAAAESVAGTLR
jgi:histidine ammonia-lyase